MVQLATTTEFLPMPKWHAQAEDVHGFASKVGSATRMGGKLVNTVTKAVPKNVLSGIAATKFLGGIGLLFAIPTLIKGIHAVATANSAFDRVKHVAKSLLAAKDIPDGAADTVEALQAVKVISAETLSWVGIVGKILYPFQFLSLALSINTLRETASFDTVMRKNVFNKDLQTACNYIIANKKKIEGSLGFGAESKIDERAQAILKKIADNDPAVEKEGKIFLRSFQGRITAKLAFNVLGIALRIGAIVTTGLLLFAQPTIPIVAAGFALAVAGIVNLIAEKVVINKNPFPARAA